MYNRKALRRFLPGGINDGGGFDFPSGTFRPFELGTGFGVGVGSSTSAYGQYSPQQQFENDLFGGNSSSGTHSKQQNPFAFITATGTGSYAETRDTGHTLGSRGEEIIPEGVPTENKPWFEGEHKKEDSDLVIQEGKTKRLGAFGGEEFVNVLNAGTRFGLGIANNIATNKLQKENALDMAAVENAVGSTTEIDEGDWHQAGQELGQFRRRGQDRNSRATFGNFAGDTVTSKYGGYMQDGGSSGYRIGQEVTMTPEELEGFLRAGGEVDYI